MQKKYRQNKMYFHGAFFMVAVFFVVVGVDYVRAFVEPTVTAPGGNVTAPITAGSPGQAKEGPLILNTDGTAQEGLVVDKGEFEVRDGESSFSNGSYSDPDSGNDYDAKFGGSNRGIVVRGVSYLLDALGIGDSTPDTDLLLDVEGKIGATEYCDEDGANCTPAGALGGGVQEIDDLNDGKSDATSVSTGSVFLGHNSGTADDGANRNIGLGRSSLAANTSGVYNTAIGNAALLNNTTGVGNSGMGVNALRNNLTGNYNYAVGVNALFANTTGVGNNAVGYLAMRFNQGGNYNNASGYQALYRNVSGRHNLATGLTSLYENTTGNYNSAYGTYTLRNTTGTGHTAIGYYAGRNTTSGNYNTYLGYGTGSNVTTGSRNTAIGFEAEVPVNTANNQLSIKNIIYGTGLTGTNTTISPGNIGIGIKAPSEKLTVDEGNILISRDAGVPKLLLDDGRSTFTGEVSQRSDGRISISTREGVYGSNGLEIMDSGSVAIGEAAPDATLKLDVEGQIGATEYCDENGANCTPAGTLGGTTTFTGLTDTPGSYTPGSVYFAGASAVAEDNPNLFWNDSTNRLGIGTATPTRSLEIERANTARLRIDALNSGAPAATAAIELDGFGGRAKGIFLTDKSTTNEWFIGEGFGYQGIGIGHDSTASGQSEYSANATLFVNASDEVGVNTVNPATELDVVGSITSGASSATTGVTFLQSRYIANETLNTFGAKRSSGVTTIGYGVRPNSAASNYISSVDNVPWTRGVLEVGAGLRFLSTPSATSTATGTVESGLAQVFTVQPGGDVGIGDTTPDGTLKLDVEGQVGATEYCDENGANCVSSTVLGTVDTLDTVTTAGNTTTNDISVGTTTIGANEKLEFGDYVSTNDHISLYGSGTAGYGIGVEASTLYNRSAVNHRWYIGSLADGGASENMELDSNSLNFNNKNALQYNDTWLRLNNNSQFTSGVYTPGRIRADAGFQVDGKNVINASGAVISARYPNDTRYGFFEARNDSGSRGFYLGNGNGGNTVQFNIDAANILDISGGDVGIGDSTPDGTLKLDVEGQVGATEYCDENGANCTPAGSLGGITTFTGLTDTPGSYTPGSVYFAGASAVAENNTNLFWDNSSRRLGIGTNTPTEQLDVRGNAHIGTGDSNPKLSVGQAGAFAFADPVFEFTGILNRASINMGFDSNPEFYQFVTHQTCRKMYIATANTPRLSIGQNGSVGIGQFPCTDVATEDFFVKGRATNGRTTASFGQQVGLGRLITGIEIDTVSSTSTYAKINAVDNDSGGTDQGKNLILQSNDVIGNVGIGTLTPTEKLEVNGNVKLGTNDYLAITSGAPSTGQGGYFQGTSEAGSNAGYGSWMNYNAFWDGSSWIQPRGTLPSKLYTSNYHLDWSWQVAAAGGTNGNAVTPTEVASLSSAGDFEIIGAGSQPGGGSWTNSSDIRLKDIGKNYTYGLKEINQLRPVRFNYKVDNERGLPSDEEYVGFIAQEVRDVIPDAVSEGEDGFLDFNMHSVSVAIINAIQEIDQKISVLFNRDASQQQEIDLLTEQVEQQKILTEQAQERLRTIEKSLQE